MAHASDSPSERASASSRDPTSSRVSPLRLGWVFLHIGTLAFGGLGAALALVERELVVRRRLLTAAEITEALTYTKLLPGSTVVQVMAYLGYKLGGWPGSALATAAFVFPSAVVMLLLAAAYVAATVLPALGPAINGLSAAVVGILLTTTYRLGKTNITTPLMGGIALIAFIAVAFVGLNAASIVVGAGLVGVGLFAAPTATAERQQEGAR